MSRCTSGIAPSQMYWSTNRSGQLAELAESDRNNSLIRIMSQDLYVKIFSFIFKTQHNQCCIHHIIRHSRFGVASTTMPAIDEGLLPLKIISQIIVLRCDQYSH